MQDRTIWIEKLRHLKEFGDAKTTRNSYASQNRLCKSWIERHWNIWSVDWSRRCYAISFISVWNEILLGSQGTVNQTTSCQHTLSKKTSASHWRGTQSWLNSYAPELVPVFYYRDKTRVQMFYYLNRHKHNCNEYCITKTV